MVATSLLQVSEGGAATLLVVGPRERERPGIEAAALGFLAAALGRVVILGRHPET